MICGNCRDHPRLALTMRHKYCINNWRKDPKNIGAGFPRDIPIKACACQHKQSWNYVTNVTQETKDTNGDRKES